MVVYEGGSEDNSAESRPALPAPAAPGHVAGEGQQLAIEDAPLLAIENGPVACEGVESKDVDSSVETCGANLGPAPSGSSSGSTTLPGQDEQRALEIRRELIRPGQQDRDNRVLSRVLNIEKLVN